MSMAYENRQLAPVFKTGTETDYSIYNNDYNDEKQRDSLFSLIKLVQGIIVLDLELREGSQLFYQVALWGI